MNFKSLDDIESRPICALCDGGALVWREGGGDGEDGAEVVGRLGGGVGEGDPVHVRHDVRVDDERSELRVKGNFEKCLLYSKRDVFAYLLLFVNLVVQACICADQFRAHRSDMEVLSQLFGRLCVTRHTYIKDILQIKRIFHES